MKEYSVNGLRYLIPKELEGEFEELVRKLPGWLGMYIAELEKDWESYILN